MAYTSRHRRSVRLLSCEKLEARLCLSGVSFASHDIRVLGGGHGFSSVYAADIDADGDLDVLAANNELGEIAWYENADGKGRFGEHQPITRLGEGPFRSQGQARGAKSVYAADVDGDGDMDALSASSPSGVDGKIAWYENIDGKGSFGPQQVIITDADGANSVHAADIDGDGDVDVLSASASLWSPYRLAWHENLPTGDVNRDSHFDQQDLVQVLQAAKYLTGQPATFDEGDWNGDNVFDQLDIVAALQTGNYLQGLDAAVDAVFGGV